MPKTATTALLMVLALMTNGTNCARTKPDQLDQLGKIRLLIEGQPFELWIADNTAEQAQGLMFVTAERMAPLADGTQRGMIFVFDAERQLNFWMRNTIIPLDIAYLTSGGVVAATHTMAPLDERPGQYPSRSPARYAIEVSAGVWDALGLRPGDRIEIPAALLKRTP